MRTTVLAHISKVFQIFSKIEFQPISAHFANFIRQKLMLTLGRIVILLFTHVVYGAFPNATHPFQRPVDLFSSQVLRKPFPTGAWWVNLVLSESREAIAPMPYSLKILPNHNVAISYPFRVVTDDIITQGFSNDLMLERTSQPKVVAFDSGSVTLRFDSTVQLHLVRGSPYLTFEYLQAESIQFTTSAAITKLIRISATESQLELSSGQKWILFTSNPITWNLSASVTLQSLESYSGILRIAMIPSTIRPEIGAEILRQHAKVYPIGLDISLDQDQNLQFQWKWKSFTPNCTQEVLMLALPHHEMKSDLPLQYFAMKGPMIAITGATWTLASKKVPIQWTMDVPVHLHNVLKETLLDDLTRLPTATTTYTFGKEIARYARLALIADQLELPEASRAVEVLKDKLEPWLNGTAVNPFRYDTTWGGIVTLDALRDKNAEFGAGYYNDHHFHYGYFLYALAVVGKFDPMFLQKYNSEIYDLMGDIGTISKENDRFPRVRHKDWWAGHSYASGLFPMASGKAQESSSEAVHAYYAMTLLAQVLKDSEQEKYSQALLFMEIQATQSYWHMENQTRGIYEPRFVVKNRMIGVVSEMQVARATWFGNAIQFVHGINLMPFTPISQYLLRPSFVRKQLQVWTIDPDQNDIWTTIGMMDQAIVSPMNHQLWEKMRHRPVEAFDDGNSKTNALYWIASRPGSTFTSNAVTQSVEICSNFPSCAALDCCKTFPGCCNTIDPSVSNFLCCSAASQPIQRKKSVCHAQPLCATAGVNGTALGCCSTDEGCCPGLGCCINSNFKDTTSSTWIWLPILLVAMFVSIIVVGPRLVRRSRYNSLDDNRMTYCVSGLICVVFLVMSFLFLN